METTEKQFNDFQVQVLNRLEILHKENEELTRHVVQIKTVLFGADGENGRLKVTDKRLESHAKEIRRLWNLVWPIVGAILLLGWLGVSNLSKILSVD